MVKRSGGAGGGRDSGKVDDEEEDDIDDEHVGLLTTMLVMMLLPMTGALVCGKEERRSRDGEEKRRGQGEKYRSGGDVAVANGGCVVREGRGTRLGYQGKIENDQENINRGWHAELAPNIAPFAALQPPTAHSQLVMMSLPEDVLLKVHEATQDPYLIDTLTFSDWAVISGIYEFAPETLERKIQALAHSAPIIVSRNRIENREISKIIANGEKTILENFGYSTAHLTNIGDIDVSEQVNVKRQERRRRIGLSQAEIDYLEKQQEKRLNAVLATASTAADSSGKTHKLAQDSHFLPLVSSAWIERQSKHVSHKLWHLDNFNYTAPISVEAYKALANLSDKDLKNCKEAADSFALLLPNNRPAFDGGFPLLAILDKTKCPVSKQVLVQKGFPRVPPTLEEVKKMWNTGRPYLKCTCTTNCGKSITWFDHFVWYYIANLDFFDPNAPSDITRMLDFQQRLETEWRQPVLAQVSFLYMRKMMTSILERLIDNPKSTAEQLLEHPSLKDVPFAKRFAAILLPEEADRAKTPSSRRRARSPANDMVQRSRSRQTTLTFATTPNRQPDSAPSPASQTVHELRSGQAVSAQIQMTKMRLAMVDGATVHRLNASNRRDISFQELHGRGGEGGEGGEGGGGERGERGEAGAEGGQRGEGGGGGEGQRGDGGEGGEGGGGEGEGGRSGKVRERGSRSGELRSRGESDYRSRSRQLKKTILQLKEKVQEKRAKLSAENLRYCASRRAIRPVDLSEDDVTCARVLRGHMKKVYAIDWCQSKADRLVSASQDGWMVLWNAFAGTKVQSIRLDNPFVMTCAYSPGGHLVARGGLDNLCAIYSIARLRAGKDVNLPPIRVLSGHKGYVSCCKFMSEGQILTASGDQTCMLWDVSTNKRLHKFGGEGGSATGHKEDVMSISVSPSDGHIFLSGSCDKTAKLWDTRTPGSAQITFHAHKQDVNAVQFHADGFTFGTGSDDGTCALFDTRSAHELARYGDEAVFGGPNAKAVGENRKYIVTSIAFSHSGRLLFAGCANHKCRVYDTLTGKKLLELPHDGQDREERSPWVLETALVNILFIELFDGAFVNRLG
ncbi:hypothetical protein CBR_g55033 [Chara braunii]|uniref:Uncharacterized protein n=1 Tax=Chara braunii TaxID=69332 RepID=A0A388MCH3_CHABU|nr:hypothetical protein CBR_g55033 [Chara braunii]|eukprot:GBG92264.1 hypothetical protein CBR_g55033 [Chara braunii]